MIIFNFIFKSYLSTSHCLNSLWTLSIAIHSCPSTQTSLTLVLAPNRQPLPASLPSADTTEAFVKPMVAALQLEGSPFLKTPCNSDFPTNPTCQYPSWPGKSLVPGTKPKPPNPLPPSDCTCGSPWVMSTAHKMMAGLDQIPAGSVPGPRSVVSNDAFHDVSDVTPFHLAHIFNAGSCGSGPCVLNATTVDMVSYVCHTVCQLKLFCLWCLAATLTYPEQDLPRFGIQT